MRVRTTLALAALAVTLLAPAAASARGSDAAAAAKAEHNRIVNYWTAERMASAKHKDYVRNGQGKIVPFAKPGGSGGAVTGASWTGNGEIEKRSGKLFFSTSAGNWQCSASVVNDGTGNNQSIILTAGHCTYDGSEGWSFNVLYIPDYDSQPTRTCGSTVYGCWTATREAVSTTFVNEGGFGSEASVAVDYGFMRMGLGGKPGQSLELDAVTGGYGINTATLSNSIVKWAFGYPAAGKYKGADLVYCKGQTINDPYGANTWGVACNMTGGSSGGPWIYGNDNPATYTPQTLLTSLNSYGYQGLTYMFGPKFNNATQTVANAAGSGSGSGATVHTIP